MHWISVIIFSIVSPLNIYFNKCNAGNAEKKGAFITKLLILPALFLIYLSSGAKFSLLLAGALLTCWCGDIVLGINFRKTQSNSMIVMGTGLICFLTGHVFYSILFLQHIRFDSNMIFLAPFYLIYLFFSLILFPCFKLKGLMATGVTVYFLGETFMSFSCLLLLIYNPGLPGALLFTGSLFFIISDSVLGYSFFVRNPPQHKRIVMGSYISAQLLIVTGYILLLI